MGTDIHLFVERRKAPGMPWETIAVMTQCSWCDGSGNSARGEVCFKCNGRGEAPGYDDRNYDVFAILGNVRNGRGFAGIKTGDGFEPISDKRGFPSDMSEFLQQLVLAKSMEPDGGYPDDHEFSWESLNAKYGSGWFGDHSWSWVTLRELLKYDWTRLSTHYGEVSPREFYDWQKTWNVGISETAKRVRAICGDESADATIPIGAPASYHGQVSGQLIRKVSPDTMSKIVACCVFNPEKDPQDMLGQEAPVSYEFTEECIAAASAEYLTYQELLAWANGSKRREGRIYIFAPIAFRTTHAEDAGRFHSVFIPALTKVGDPDNVRLVFGFDS